MNGNALYLSRLKLNPLSRDVSQDISDVSHMHRTIMGAFPERETDENPRAFYQVLYRLELNRRTGEIVLYVQSNCRPDWGRLPESYVVNPDASRATVKMIGEHYANIRDGDRLRFRLRANPTRKIDTKSMNGVRRHGRRVPVRGEHEQVAWLQRVGSRHGFQLTSVEITSSGSPELWRGRQKNRTFQGVVYEGTLVVVDAEHFRNALSRGIGPAKAFGFGLLSIAKEYSERP